MEAALVLLTSNGLALRVLALLRASPCVRRCAINGILISGERP